MEKSFKLIFLHLPKAGGSTLNGILESRYPGNEIFMVKVRNNKSNLPDFLQLNEEEKNKIKLLTGHVVFGIHNQFNDNAVYFTVVRHPVSRIISYYHYVRRRPTHGLFPLVSTLSLKEFVLAELDRVDIHNGQTYMLTGPEVEDTFRLEVAKKNISSHFIVIGLTDAFDKTLIVLKNKLGWEYPIYERQNVDTQRRSQEIVSPDLQELILKRNRMDYELYLYAQSLLENEFSSLGFKGKKELLILKQKNFLNPYLRRLRKWNRKVFR